MVSLVTACTPVIMLCVFSLYVHPSLWCTVVGAVTLSIGDNYRCSVELSLHIFHYKDSDDHYQLYIAVWFLNEPLSAVGFPTDTVVQM